MVTRPLRTKEIGDDHGWIPAVGPSRALDFGAWILRTADPPTGGWVNVDFAPKAIKCCVAAK
jgi:hypothetical protein